MGPAGGEASAEAREECSVAAFGPWLAESLKCFHEWMESQMPLLLREKVSYSVLSQQSCIILLDSALLEVGRSEIRVWDQPLSPA